MIDMLSGCKYVRGKAFRKRKNEETRRFLSY
jgi:hypothetical protein